MPHLVIEYSSNLDDRLDIDALVTVAHESLVGAGPFPLGGIRTRAVARQRYRIADGHPDNGFIHLTLTIGGGRDEATKAAVGSALFEAVAAFVPPDIDGVALSCYLFEADPAVSWKAGTLHDAVARRREAASRE